jgi:hypothetical protein
MEAKSPTWLKLFSRIPFATTNTNLLKEKGKIRYFFFYLTARSILRKDYVLIKLSFFFLNVFNQAIFILKKVK